GPYTGLFKAKHKSTTLRTATVQ
nr:putative 3B [Enterovirus H]